jgi:hypothetical protein
VVDLALFPQEGDAAVDGLIGGGIEPHLAGQLLPAGLRDGGRQNQRRQRGYQPHPHQRGASRRRVR